MGDISGFQDQVEDDNKGQRSHHMQAEEQNIDPLANTALNPREKNPLSKSTHHLSFLGGEGWRGHSGTVRGVCMCVKDQASHV